MPPMPSGKIRRYLGKKCRTTTAWRPSPKYYNAAAPVTGIAHAAGTAGRGSVVAAAVAALPVAANCFDRMVAGAEVLTAGGRAVAAADRAGHSVFGAPPQPHHPDNKKLGVFHWGPLKQKHHHVPKHQR